MSSDRDHSSGVDPERKSNFGKTPVVGQTKPYVSGSNAHGKHEKRRTSVSSRAGVAPASQPKQRSY